MENAPFGTDNVVSTESLCGSVSFGVDASVALVIGSLSSGRRTGRDSAVEVTGGSEVGVSEECVLSVL